MKLTFRSRNAEPSAARSAMMKGFVFICLSLAALGIFELKAGHVNSRMLIPVGIEVTFALAFLHAANKVHTASIQLQGK